MNGSTGKVVGFSTMADFDVKEEDGEGKAERPAGGGPLFPVVDFEARNGLKLPPVLVPSLDVTVENANGKTEAKRVQVPLILAW